MSWGKGEKAESFLHLQINEQTDKSKLKEIEDLILAVLVDVDAAVRDWQPMLSGADDTIEELKKLKLKRLDLGSCPRLTDLGCLKDVPLESLNVSQTEVKDLSPVKNKPTLKTLDSAATPATPAKK